jgi:hypothetical protein
MSDKFMQGATIRDNFATITSEVLTASCYRKIRAFIVHVSYEDDTAHCGYEGKGSDVVALHVDMNGVLHNIALDKLMKVLGL